MGNQSEKIRIGGTVVLIGWMPELFSSDLAKKWAKNQTNLKVLDIEDGCLIVTSIRKSQHERANAKLKVPADCVTVVTERRFF